MSIKALVLAAFTLVSLYNLLLLFIEKRSCSNPIPECVQDVYDAESYARWRRYSAEKLRVALVSEVVSFAVGFILLWSNAYAWAARLWAGSVYSELFAVILFTQLTETVFSVVFSYIDDMIIEQKYGFNRTTLKTFIADQVKGFIISILLMTVLVCALAAIYRALGDWMLILFTAVVMVIMLGITFLYPYFSKLFNKFTDLEEGELRDKLTGLLESHGYHVRGIKVMDASKRSSKSNAYFTGFGKTKTIVLYDTLLNQMDADELCAVFAHEMGHGLNKDTTKNQLFSLINIFMMALVVWGALKWEGLYTEFGFEGINYAFALNIAVGEAFAIVSPLLGLFSNWRSRKAEYRADAQAVKEGYGEALISALKKLTRANFGHLAPSRLLVKLNYSHPTLADRIMAVRKLEQGTQNGK